MKTVDPKTMLFTELDETEATELLEGCEALVLTGDLPQACRETYFEPWCKQCGFEDRQSLMVLSTVFPARALLSLVRFLRQRSEVKNLIDLRKAFRVFAGLEPGTLTKVEMTTLESLGLIKKEGYWWVLTGTGFEKARNLGVYE